MLDGKIALVAGGTRGAGRGIAVELGAAGATVYVTGRSTRGQRSEYDRPETIEDTADLINQAGGKAIAVRVDHLLPEEVQALVARIRSEQGRLDILVNDIWGGEKLFEWNKAVWEHDLDKGLRLLRLGLDTHLITAHHALPLLIERPGGLLVEMTDGTADYNAGHYRLSPFYDLVKSAVIRLAWGHAKDLAKHLVRNCLGWCQARHLSTASPKPTRQIRHVIFDGVCSMRAPVRLLWRTAQRSPNRSPPCCAVRTFARFSRYPPKPAQRASFCDRRDGQTLNSRNISIR